VSQLILPRLPEKLTIFYQEQEKIRTQSLSFIDAESDNRIGYQGEIHEKVISPNLWVTDEG